MGDADLGLGSGFWGLGSAHLQYIHVYLDFILGGTLNIDGAPIVAVLMLLLMY